MVFLNFLITLPFDYDLWRQPQFSLLFLYMVLFLLSNGKLSVCVLTLNVCCKNLIVVWFIVPAYSFCFSHQIYLRVKSSLCVYCNQYFILKLCPLKRCVLLVFDQLNTGFTVYRVVVFQGFNCSTDFFVLDNHSNLSQQ